MAMVNMKRSAEEAGEGNEATACSKSEYSYGLEIRLDEEALAKLGIGAPPAVGTVMQITASVTVSSASQNKTMDGEVEASSCWQITDMEVAAKPKDPATALYAKQ